MEYYLNYIAVGLGVSAITFTISVTSIAKPVREFISKIHPKLEELIHCPWCLSFWFLLAIVSSWDIPPIHIFKWNIVNIIFTLFSIYSICGLIHFVLLRTYKPIAEMLVNREIQKLNRQ